MEIDLGNELVIKVKYAGSEYSLREPTVGEIEKFRATDEKVGVDALVGLLETLGMPKGIVQSMGLSKAKALVDGLMELMVKKN